jgi:hypothetical protein
MQAALAGLAVGLQAELLRLQQLAHHGMTDLVPTPVQRGREMAQALAGPAQGRHRIAPLIRLDQRQQIRQQRRVGFRPRLASSTGPAHPSGRQQRCLLQLPQTAPDRAGRQSRCLRYRGNAAIPCRPRFGRRHQASLSLVQFGQDSSKTDTDGSKINHPPTLRPVLTFRNPASSARARSRFTYLLTGP